MMMPPEMASTEAERRISESLEASADALAPCIVLTAEEAAANVEALKEGLTYAEACDTWPQGPHEKADHEGHKQQIRDALVLLTPDQEDDIDKQILDMEC